MQCKHMMDCSALQVLALLLDLLAWFCALSTALLPCWLTMSTPLLPMESYQLGLWQSCVVQDVGGTECRAYDSLLGLSENLKLARLLICSSLVLGMLGILLCGTGLELVNSCEDRMKRTLSGVGGVLALLSGLLCLLPVSFVAHFAVKHFFDDTVPEVVPRWEFGDALYCGWAAGFLQIVSGLLFVSHCWWWQTQMQPQPEVALQSRRQVMNVKTRCEYV